MPEQHAALEVLHPHPLRRLLAGVDDLRHAAVARGRGVVEVRDQAAADLVAERHAAVGVEQVRLVVVDEVLDAREPLAVPGRVRAVPLLVARRGRWVVEVGILRVGPVVRHAGERALLVGTVALLPPGEAGAEVLGDAERQALRLRGLLPVADDVAVRAHLHRVPAVVLRVPEVEVVVVDAHADEVTGARLLVERHQALGVPLLRLPERDHVLVARLRRVAVALEVVLVLLVALEVHVACVPVAEHRHRLRPPVRPDAELRVAEPVGAVVLGERLVGRRERALGDHHGRRRRRDRRHRRERRQRAGEGRSGDQQDAQSSG